MKKILIVLLSLAVVGIAIAQDAPSIKFSGYLNSGIEADVLGSNDPTVKAYAQDADVNGIRFNLDGAVVNGDVGANFRLRSTGDAAGLVSTQADKMATNFPYLGFGYVWANMASQMVKVKAGLVDDGTFATAGDIGDDVGEGTGVQVIVMPADGFAFEGAMYAADMFGTAVTYWNAKYVMGVSYTMADTFKFVGSYATAAVKSKANVALLGLQILAVPQLSASFELKLADLNDYSNTGIMTVAETLSYDMSPVKVGLTAYQWQAQKAFVSGTTTYNKDLGYKANPWVSYTSGIMTPKLGITYDVNDGASQVSGKDATQLTVKPQVTFAVGPNASIVGAYAYSANTKWGSTASSDDDTQKVYIDFLWTF